jgi:hypothetical protein
MIVTDKVIDIDFYPLKNFANVIKFARENKMNPNDLFYMTRRERLISEEIYLREFEDVRKPWEYIYNDKEWQKNVSILQENGMLW